MFVGCVDGISVDKKMLFDWGNIIVVDVYVWGF